MKNLEKLLGQELKRLDAINMPDRLTEIRRRGRRQRLCMMTATGLAVSAVAFVSIWGSVIGDTKDSDGVVRPAPQPSEKTQTFERYTIMLGNGFDADGNPIQGTGTLELNSTRETACVETQLLGVNAAHIHQDEVATAVVSILEPSASYEPTMCARNQDAATIRAIIEGHEDHYIEFHAASGGTITSRLEPHNDELPCATADSPQMTNEDTSFNPRGSSREGDNEILPIIFPDGSTGDLVYPAELQLDELAVRPGTTGGTSNGMIRPQISHGGISFRVEGPVDCLEGNGGDLIPVWRWKGRADVIVLRFGDWHVSVFERFTDLETWAKHLRGSVRGGWLELRGSGKLQIGPERQPGDSLVMFSDQTNILSLWPLDCGRDGGEVTKVGPSEKFTSFCIDSVEIHAQGEESFVRAVAEGVRLRDLQTRFPLKDYQIIP